MGFHLNPLKQGKRSNTLLNFKLETMSQSPSQISGKCRSHNGEDLEQYEGKKIKFPSGAEDVVKSVMLINLGRLFRKWKFEMNTNYVKKGLVPKYMVKIIEAQWKEFVQQKTDPKALAISNEFAEMSKKNIYPHRKGSSRYVGKIHE
jgi:hypothetical protein